MHVESCDRSFVLGAQSGERSAFNALVRKCRHRFMKLSMRDTRNRADAEDGGKNTFRNDRTVAARAIREDI
jgi:DNA-directed RNA polymerase specialized sigma24 family protein